MFYKHVEQFPLVCQTDNTTKNTRDWLSICCVRLVGMIKQTEQCLDSTTDATNLELTVHIKVGKRDDILNW